MQHSAYHSAYNNAPWWNSLGLDGGVGFQCIDDDTQFGFHGEVEMKFPRSSYLVFFFVHHQTDGFYGEGHFLRQVICILKSGRREHGQLNVLCQSNVLSTLRKIHNTSHGSYSITNPRFCDERGTFSSKVTCRYLIILKAGDMPRLKGFRFYLPSA